MMRGLLTGCCVAGTLAMSPAAALAASGSGRDLVDVRMEGYAVETVLDPSGTALMWLLTIGLALLCVGVMFKNAKRSHLD